MVQWTSWLILANLVNFRIQQIY
uniref:Uncharacterized protein n=1 Tax=Anguilla anguilla TaxID=7936 RepID=A0A0E9VSK4_ANGAN